MKNREENETPEVVMPKCDPSARLAGQKALVTGASSGIGRGIAVELGRHGADVVVNYIGDDSRADETVREVRETGAAAYAHRADVSDEDQVVAMMDRMVEELGAVDIVVCNAGIQSDAPLHEMSLEKWRKVIDVNLTGQFLCAREAVRRFREQGVRKEVSCAAGKIISISSVHDVIPWADHANYAASKGGVKLLMQSIAQEVAPHRIRVNCISPGAVRTPINRSAWETDEAYRSLLHLIPYNRIGEVDDIGRVAAWLASDEADYITGAVLYVDGGMTLYPAFESGAG